MVVLGSGDEVILIGPKINIKPFALQVQAKYQYTKICFLLSTSQTPGSGLLRPKNLRIANTGYLRPKISGDVKIIKL